MTCAKRASLKRTRFPQCFSPRSTNCWTLSEILSGISLTPNEAQLETNIKMIRKNDVTFASEETVILSLTLDRCNLLFIDRNSLFNNREFRTQYLMGSRNWIKPLK